MAPPLRYHTVAYIPDAEDVRPLDSHENLKSVREQVRLWNERGGPPLLDKNIRYEIWRSKKIACEGVKLDKPLIRPHAMVDHRYIYDGVHVVVARMDTPGQQLVFSAQPLHSLGAVATDFFFRPELLLNKADASRFARKARKAISGSSRSGFEAVLQVQRPRRPFDHSPRNFEGISDLGDGTKVTVIVDPEPLL